MCALVENEKESERKNENEYNAIDLLLTSTPGGFYIENSSNEVDAPTIFQNNDQGYSFQYGSYRREQDVSNNIPVSRAVIGQTKSNSTTNHLSINSTQSSSMIPARKRKRERSTERKRIYRNREKELYQELKMLYDEGNYFNMNKHELLTEAIQEIKNWRKEPQ